MSSGVKLKQPAGGLWGGCPSAADSLLSSFPNHTLQSSLGLLISPEKGVYLGPGRSWSVVVLKVLILCCLGNRAKSPV